MIDYSNQYERSVLSQSLICPKLIDKKVDFHQKIHLLHYNSLFVHLFFVFFVYFCNCVLIAA